MQLFSISIYLTTRTVLITFLFHGDFSLCVTFYPFEIGTAVQIAAVVTEIMLQTDTHKDRQTDRQIER
jgi:hypothetical protein